MRMTTVFKGIVLAALAAFGLASLPAADPPKPPADAKGKPAPEQPADPRDPRPKFVLDDPAIKKAEEQKAALEKAVADRAAAEKAAADAKAALIQAEKDLAEKRKAAQETSAKVAAARTTAERLATEKLFDEIAAVQAAILKAETEKATAEKTITEKSRAVEKAIAAANTAKTAADKAAAEAAAAKTKLEKAAEAEKAAAEKALQDKEAAAKAAADKAKSAQEAADKATAEKNAAEQEAARKAEEIRANLPKLASAKAVAYGGLKPLADNAWDRAKARHLLCRAGFGGTPEEVDRLHAMGLHQAVDSLVNYKKRPIPDVAFNAVPPERPEPYENRLKPEDRNKLQQRRQNREYQQLHQMRMWWLKRMAESPRPLQEKMTLFWHGHFACEYQVIENSYSMYLQNQIFREHATGNFGALLHGIVHDATMLRYLNNNVNVKGRPNENLAREIMELFSMGLGNYTEEDIREAARALTGYNYDHWSGQFRFIEGQHDPAPKTIFGQTGTWGGDDLVQIILRQPATSRFIARKLFVYFVHDEPDPATVDRLAAVLRANNYELAPMLENLFLSEEFYSPKAMGTQIKSPVHLVAGTLRELGVKDVNYDPLVHALRSMGQDLFQPPSVKGWDGGRAWIDANRIFLRYNAIANLVESLPRPNNRRGIDVLGSLPAGKEFKDAGEIVDHLAKCYLAQPLSEGKRKALIEFVGELPPPADWPKKKDEINAKLTALLALLMSSPEYQMT